jgi:hypothetical protein
MDMKYMEELSGVHFPLLGDAVAAGFAMMFELGA